PRRAPARVAAGVRPGVRHPRLRSSSFGEDGALGWTYRRRRPIDDPGGDTMIKIANAQLWVHDQNEALAFYTDKLGWEVRVDVTVPGVGAFRCLTVSPAGQPDSAVVLMAIPGPPVMDEPTAGQVRALMAKGFAGTVFLTTDDCRASYEELRSRGVEFVEE